MRKLKKYTSVLDGCSGENEITNRWRNHFEQLYNRIPDTSMKDEFYDRLCHDSVLNKDFVITARDVMTAVCKLKDGKAIGLDGIASEAIKCACPRLIVHLCVLFNSFLKYGYLPDTLCNLSLYHC